MSTRFYIKYGHSLMQNVKVIFYLIDRKYYLWDINQFIERRNSPVERIPRD